MSLLDDPYISALAGRKWHYPDNTFYVWFGTGAGGAWTQAEAHIINQAMQAWNGVANLFVTKYSESQFSNIHLWKSVNADHGGGNQEWGSQTYDKVYFEDRVQNVFLNTQSVYRSDPAWPTGVTAHGLFASTIVHEIGHALGLDHPFQDPGSYDDKNYPDLGNYRNDVRATIMAYEGQDRSPSAAFGHVVGPMALDIAAVQKLYGAVRSHDGNDSYSFNDFATSQSYRCIWDTGGIDSINYYGARDAVIDLRPANLVGDVGAWGYLSRLKSLNSFEPADGQGFLYGGFTIAGDVTGMIADVDRGNGVIDTGVIIENVQTGSGRDVVHGNEAHNVIKAGAGNDWEIYGNGGDDALYGEAGDDKLFGGAQNDKLYGGADNDFLWGETGHDKLYGGNGGDTLFGDEDNDILRGEAGNDWLHGGTGNDSLWGGSENDVLKGGGGDDYLHGEGGNDELWGDADATRPDAPGVDYLFGGAGDDRYYVMSADDTVSEVYRPGSGGAVDAGGIDEVITTLLRYKLYDSDISKIENLTYQGLFQFIGSGNSLDNVITGGGTDDFLYGGLGNDTLHGNRGGDYLHGEEGNDSLHGGRDNDWLYGEDGNDALYGEDENDVLYGGAGIDSLSGGAGRDKLYGGVDGDYLDGGTGNDMMAGGAGDDWYYVSQIVEDIQEVDGEGTDTVVVRNFSGYILDANVENLRAESDGGITRAYGNELDNVMTGFPNIGGPLPGQLARYQLFGGGGKDTLTGSTAGKTGDLLDGGTGDDTLIGLNGDDVLRGGEGADFLDGGSNFKVGDTADYSLATSGVTADVVHGGSKGEALGDTFVGIENITGSNFSDDLYGDDRANRLLGLDGDDFLTGGAGKDILDGGTGNDHIKAGNGDTVQGGAGEEDQVIADDSTIGSGWSFNVAGTGIEIIEGNAGNDGINGAGVTYDLFVNSHGGHDKITGGSGNDSVFGGAGDDFIHGGEGFDQLVGGEGNDTLIGGGAASFPFGDRLYGGAGDDKLTGSGNGYVLGEEDNDTITAAAGDWANGGSGNDIITGDGGVQQIEGGSGNDTLTGRGGGDYFDFADGFGSDTITDFEIGTDNLRFFLNTNLASLSELNVATVTGVGTLVELHGQTIMLLGVFTDKSTIEANSAIVIVGTAGNDELFGTSSNDMIQGLAGNDKLHGGAGNDRLEGGADRNELYGDDGDDTLVGGDTVDQMDGGAGNDTLIGTGGQTAMFGGDGNDTFIGSLNSINAMYGGVGNDTFTGGDSTDWVYETEGGDETVHAGGGDDVIVDYYGVNQLYGEGGNDLIVSASDQGSLLDGGDGDDALTAALGGNTLLGGNGNDTLEAADGGAIANIFTGGAGADTFVYRPGVGVESNVIVTDFQDGVDHIGVRSFTNSDWINVEDTPEGALITYYNGDSPMLLSGVSASVINQSDFLML